MEADLQVGVLRQTHLTAHPQAVGTAHFVMRATHKSVIWMTISLLVAAVGWSWMNDGVLAELVNAEDGATRVAQLKEYFAALGAWAPLAYVVFVVVEVVIAPLPGLMLYAPGGIVFGPFLGGLLSLIGNTIGAGIACLVTRSMGDSWLTRFFEADKLESVQAKIEARGMLLILLLRVNPLTSSDLVSYAAGFTRIPVWNVMLATTCGMAPLCFAQAWLADGLLAAFPQLFYPLLVACGIYVLIVLLTLRRLLRGTSAVNEASSS